MKIKDKTRKLAAGCSKQCFEVVDRTDEVSNHTYGKAMLTWFEEIFEKYYSHFPIKKEGHPLFLNSYPDCVASRQSCFHIRWIRL